MTPRFICFDLDGTLYLDSCVYLRMIDHFFMTRLTETGFSGSGADETGTLRPEFLTMRAVCSQAEGRASKNS